MAWSARVRPLLRHALAKPVLHLLCAAPLAWLVWGAVADTLGANPAEALIRQNGDWALRLLCAVLSVTPLRVLLGWPELARFRRLLGLWMFAYALCHLLCYSVFDMGLVWPDIVRDIAKRPFILVGFSAFVLLTPLAATSFNAAIRWLGARRWQWLHRLVYVVAPLAVLHFFWMRAGKHNFNQVALYGGWLALVLAWRLWRRVASLRRAGS